VGRVPSRENSVAKNPTVYPPYTFPINPLLITNPKSFMSYWLSSKENRCPLNQLDSRLSNPAKSYAKIRPEDNRRENF
jgi:hypothetical protein